MRGRGYCSRFVNLAALCVGEVTWVCLSVCLCVLAKRANWSDFNSTTVGPRIAWLGKYLVKVLLYRFKPLWIVSTTKKAFKMWKTFKKNHSLQRWLFTQEKLTICSLQHFPTNVCVNLWETASFESYGKYYDFGSHDLSIHWTKTKHTST